MNLDDIDRALREDENITPSREFASRVTRSVRQDAEDLGAIRFPWQRLLPGVVLCVAGVVVGILTGAPAMAPKAIEDAVLRVADALPAEALIGMIAPLVGSWIVVRVAYRLAGYQR